MMPHRLAEQRARRFPIAGIENQRAEIVERRKIRRLAANELEIVALRLLEPAFFAQKTSAFGTGGDVVGVALQRLIEFADAAVPSNGCGTFDHRSLQPFRRGESRVLREDNKTAPEPKPPN